MACVCAGAPAGAAARWRRRRWRAQAAARGRCRAAARAACRTRRWRCCVQEAGTRAHACWRTTRRRAGQPGLADQAADHLRRARPARPGLDLVARRSGCRARVSDGVLDGNLVIKGSGDPKLVLERVWLLLRRVQQLGVREIRGDIVLDRSAFACPSGRPGRIRRRAAAALQRAARRAAAELQVGDCYSFTPDAGARRGAGGRRPGAGRRAGRRAACRWRAGPATTGAAR